MEVGRQIKELIDVDKLQASLDSLSKALGLAFITVDYRGRQVTTPSGYSTFCKEGQKNPVFKERCALCDANGGFHAAITGKPGIYYCHASLVDFAVPIIDGEGYVGAVLGGQARLPQAEAAAIEYIMPRKTDWQSEPAMRGLHEAAITMPIEKLNAVLDLLRDMIQSMTESARASREAEELRQTREELLTERARLQTLDEELKAKESAAFGHQIGFESFFGILNAIAGTAYQEHAERTVEAVCDLADMMRYVMGGRGDVTLSDELDFAARMIRSQRDASGAERPLTVNVPERYRGVPCKLMALRPIIEKALLYAAQSGREDGIQIEAKQGGRELLVSCTCGEQYVTSAVKLPLGG